MTNKKIKTIIVLAMVLVASTATVFAAKPVYFSSTVLSAGEKVMPLTVETPEAVLAWFQSQGIDVSKCGTDISSMSVEYRNEIRKLYADDDLQGEIDAIAKAALQTYLEEGKVEYVTTSYGPLTWSMEFAQKDPFDSNSGEKNIAYYEN
jgi:hypothetical protein